MENIVPIDRRKFLKVPAIAGLGVVSLAKAQSLTITPTPAEAEGPFYPVVAQADQDFDLTKTNGKAGEAKGEFIFIEGKILDSNGQVIPKATIDMWQANTFGRYRHPFDRSNNAIDEHFQGWAIIQSGENGGFRFKTVIPGAYDAGQGWTRPPHLHFKVSKTGFLELTTQMYFEGDSLNDKDYLFKSKNDEEKEAMTAKNTSKTLNGEKVYRYNIVLNTI